MDMEFEAALSNSVQHFPYISGVNHKQRLHVWDCNVEAQCFRNSTNWFWEDSNFSIAATSADNGWAIACKQAPV